MGPISRGEEGAVATDVPGGGIAAGEGDEAPPTPDTVWRKFLDDTEHAIRSLNAHQHFDFRFLFRTGNTIVELQGPK
jgi:hypothetical protein